MLAFIETRRRPGGPGAAAVRAARRRRTAPARWSGRTRRTPCSTRSSTSDPADPRVEEAARALTDCLPDEALLGPADSTEGTDMTARQLLPRLLADFAPAQAAAIRRTMRMRRGAYAMSAAADTVTTRTDGQQYAMDRVRRRPAPGDRYGSSSPTRCGCSRASAGGWPGGRTGWARAGLLVRARAGRDDVRLGFVSVIESVGMSVLLRNHPAVAPGRVRARRLHTGLR